MATVTSLQFRISSSYDGGAVDRARESVSALNRDLNDLQNQSVRVTVNVDNSGLNRLRQDLDAVSRIRAVAQARVDVNTGGLDAARANLDRFGQMRVTAHADVDTSTAGAHLHQLISDSDNSSHHLGLLGLAGGDAGRALTGMGGAAGGASGGLGSVGQAGGGAAIGMSNAATAAGLVAAALAAIGPIAALTSAAVLATLGGAFIGLGALVLSKTKEIGVTMKSFKTSLEQDMMQAALAMKGPLIQGINDLQAGLHQLTPAFSQAFGAAGKLIEPLVQALLAFTRNVMPGVIQALNSAKPVFDGLRQGAAALGTGLSTMFRGMSLGAVGAGQAISTAMSGVGRILGIVGQAFGQMSAAGAKAFSGLMNGLVSLVSGAMQGFVTAVRLMNGTLGPFLATIGQLAGLILAKMLPVFAQLITQLMQGLMPVLRAVVPAFVQLGQQIGQTLLRALVVLMPALIQLGQAFAKILIALSPLIPPLTQILVAGLRVLVAVVTPFIPLLTLLATAIGKLAPVINIAATAITFMANVVTTVVKAITNWQAITNAFATAWNALWAGLKTATIAVWNALGTAWNAFTSGMRTVMSTLNTAMTTTWNTLWNTFKTVGQAAWSFIQTSWNACSNAMRTVMSALHTAMVTTWNVLWNTFKTVGQAAWNVLKAGWTACSTALRAVMSALHTAMVTTWNVLWNTFKTVANAAWNVMKSGWQAFSNTFMKIFNALKTGLTNAWNALWNVLKKALQGAVDAFKTVWNTIKKIFRDPIVAVINVVYTHGIKALWDPIAKVFGAPTLPAAPTVPSFATGGPVRGPGGPTDDVIPAMLSSGEHVWTAAEVQAAGGHKAMLDMRQSVMGNSYKPAAHGDGMGGFALGGIIPSPSDIIGALTGFFKNAFKVVGGVASAAFSTVTGFGGDIISHLKDLVMGQVGAVVNPLIQKAANVGKDLVKTIIPGSPWLEQLIVGTPTGGSVQTSGGSNPQNQGGIPGSGNGMIQQMADAIKNWITAHDIPVGGGNTAEAQKWADAQVGKPYSLGAFGSAFDCSSFMSGIASIILGKKPGPLFTTFAFTGAKQGPATFEKDLKAPFMVGVENRGIGHMAGTLNGKNYEATPPAVRSGPGARGANDPMFDMVYGMKASQFSGGQIPAGQHKAVIDAALKAAGVPPPGTLAQWEAGLNTLITRESAWNAGAVNHTDSNAAAGHPSQGLAQVIPSTFAAYHVAGTSSNILDPIANVAAAIKYIVATYGNITNVQQANASLPPKGYWAGTEHAQRGWAKVGENGAEWVWFHGGEKVRPHGRKPDTEDQHGTITVHNHWHGNPTKEAVQEASGPLVDKLRQACHARVGGRSS